MDLFEMGFYNNNGLIPKHRDGPKKLIEPMALSLIFYSVYHPDEGRIKHITQLRNIINLDNLRM